jgi:hypothetical protein
MGLCLDDDVHHWLLKHRAVGHGERLACAYDVKTSIGVILQSSLQRISVSQCLLGQSFACSFDVQASIAVFRKGTCKLIRISAPARHCDIRTNMLHTRDIRATVVWAASGMAGASVCNMESPRKAKQRCMLQWPTLAHDGVGSGLFC